MKHPKSYISTLIDTELEREVGLMMAKENFRFDDIYIFFLWQRFPKETENIFPVFLSCCRNIRERMGELENVVETVIFLLVFPQHFSFSHHSTCFSVQQLK